MPCDVPFLILAKIGLFILIGQRVNMGLRQNSSSPGCPIMVRHLSCSIAVLVLFVSTTFGHEGRRFEIFVDNDQTLWAQGSIGGGVDDGGGLVRPYLNVMHDHWANAPGLKQEAIATLPAWDIIDPHPSLQGHSLTAELVSAFKWVAPPLMPPTDTIPDFQPLSPGEVAEITNFVDVVNSNSLGSMELTPFVDIHGHFDLPIEYKINKKPENELIIFEWRLSSGNPDVNDSSSIYAILSPDGSTPAERLHHASLFTERYLGITPVPEPTSMWLAGLVATSMVLRRRRLV